MIEEPGLYYLLVPCQIVNIHEKHASPIECCERIQTNLKILTTSFNCCNIEIGPYMTINWTNLDVSYLDRPDIFERKSSKT